MNRLKLELYSKAFDKVWHDELIFKLKQNGVTGSVLTLLTNYLKNDLEVNIQSKIKFFAEDTILFSVVRDTSISASELNDDLQFINPEPNKQAAKFCFPKRTKVQFILQSSSMESRLPELMSIKI